MGLENWEFLKYLFGVHSARVLSHVWLFGTLWTVAHQDSLSVEFSSQEYWSRLSFPPPVDLPDPGIKPVSHVSPALHFMWILYSLSHQEKINKPNTRWHRGFPDRSDDKESGCNAGDPGSIPNSRRSGEEGIGYPLQYSWASLVTQGKEFASIVGDLRSIPYLKDPLEKGMATHSSIVAWKTPCIVHGGKELHRTEWPSLLDDIEAGDQERALSCTITNFTPWKPKESPVKSFLMIKLSLIEEPPPRFFLEKNNRLWLWSSDCKHITLKHNQQIYRRNWEIV